MRPLRAYLLVRRGPEEWSVTTHRDLEGLRAEWAAQPTDSARTAVVHVGFDRPDTIEFEEVASRFSGRVLLTAAARYAFPSPEPVAPVPAGTARFLPLYVSLSGWGYECA